MKTLRVFRRHFIDQMDLHTVITVYVIITNVAGRGCYTFNKWK